MRATEGHRDVPASSGKGQSDVLADPRGRPIGYDLCTAATRRLFGSLSNSNPFRSQELVRIYVTIST